MSVAGYRTVDELGFRVREITVELQRLEWELKNIPLTTPRNPRGFEIVARINELCPELSATRKALRSHPDHHIEGL